MRRKEKSTNLFDSFSSNLEKVLFRLNGKLNIDEFDENDRLYLCPISMKVYSDTSLTEDSDDKLTVEHVPPKCLGGKGICLTAKDFNNKATDLDYSLKEWVDIHGFYNLGQPFNTTATIDDLQRFRLNLNFSNDKPKLTFIGNFKNPKADTIIEKIKNQKEFKVKAKIPNNTISNKTKISILKNAYLIAFSNLGYEFIFGFSKLVHPIIYQIRECILYKNEDFNLWFVQEYDYPDNMEGLSFIITETNSIALSVCFRLRSTLKLQVFLPNPEANVFNQNDVFLENRNYKYYTLNHVLPIVKNPQEEDNLSYWDLYMEFLNFLNK
jgi:hypothetical protein